MYGVLILVPLFAWLGYREAAKFARDNDGRPPWGLPPAAWAVLTGVSLLVGGILLAIARRTTQPPTAWLPPGPANLPPAQPTSGAPAWQAPATSAALPEQLTASDPWTAPAAQAADQPVTPGHYQPTIDILPGR